MPHKFDFRKKHKLDNAKRREMLPPEKTLIDIGLHEGDIMADVGCGIGYFTIPAAKIVGDSGYVFAMDILPEMLQDVQLKARENNSSNIDTVLTEENNLKLESDKVNFAFLSTVLHETQDKRKFLNEIKRIVSPGGKIAIVEWEKVENEFGPTIDDRLDKADLEEMLSEIGFCNISSMNIGTNFYALIAQNN